MTHYRGIRDSKLYKNLNDAIRKDCILITGCGLLLHARTDGDKSPPTTWNKILGEMVDWCELRIPIGDVKGVEDREKLKNIRHLVATQCFVEAELAIDRYLADKIRLQQCLRSVLLHDKAKISQLHRLIVTLPFRAYLTTSYDTFIEDAYLSVHGHRLNTFTEASIHIALEEYREKRPFVLKLHGDVDNPASITLTDRTYKQRLESTDVFRDGLQLLISKASFLITGFEKDDSEVKFLEALLYELKEPTSLSKQWIVVPKEQCSELKENEEISIVQYIYDEKHTELLHFFAKLESYYKPKGLSNENREIKEKAKQKRRNTTSSVQQEHSTEVFVVYAHVEQDEEILKNLTTHLKSLESYSNIFIWSDLEILPGTNEKQEIQNHWYTAKVILLLVSPDFIKKMDEDFEIRQIMNRQKAEGIPVIPIIIRPIEWKNAPFGELTALPKNNKAVSTWTNQDEAYREITEGIRSVLTNRRKDKAYPPLRLISSSDSSPNEVS